VTTNWYERQQVSSPCPPPRRGGSEAEVRGECETGMGSRIASRLPSARSLLVAASLSCPCALPHPFPPVRPKSIERRIDRRSTCSRPLLASFEKSRESESVSHDSDVYSWRAPSCVISIISTWHCIYGMISSGVISIPPACRCKAVVDNNATTRRCTRLRNCARYRGLVGRLIIWSSLIDADVAALLASADEKAGNCRSKIETIMTYHKMKFAMIAEIVNVSATYQRM